MREPITIPPELMHLRAQELADRLGCSRQYIGMLKRKAQGLCIECGKRATSGVLCLKCAKGRRKSARLKYGHKAWKAGKRGRPPMERKESSDV